MMAMPSVRWLLTLCAFILCFHTGSGQVCPFGWVERGGSDLCYLLQSSPTRYKFDEATGKCQSYGGQLLVIRSSAEKDWVLRQLQGLTSSFPNIKTWWMGLKSSSDHFAWVDDSPVTMDLVPWVGGQPSAANGQCVALRAQGAVGLDCNTWQNIICTRNKSAPLRCDVDSQWHHISGSCFKTFLDKRTWEDAKNLCDLQNGQLAKVMTFEEHAHLWDVARSPTPAIALWTGLHTAPDKSGQLSLEWLDGSAADSGQTYWKDGIDLNALSPDSSMMIDGSVQRRLKSWDLDNNTALHAYACQRPQGVCEDGWLTHQSTCFKFYDMAVQWTEAKSFCADRGGQLVNLASVSDQLFVQRYLLEFAAMGPGSFWIGLSDNGNDQGPFRWTGGEEVGPASHWAQKPPPSNTVGSRDCGYILTDDPDGRWQMTSDCLQPRAFLCTIPVNVPVMDIQITPPLSRLHCEQGWEKANGQCYHFADRVLSWAESQSFCVSLGSHLAIIRNQADQAFIDSHVSGANYWVGLSDLQTEGIWVWMDNSTVSSFENWATNEPNSLGQEDCGSVWGTKGQSMLGKWNDKDCSTPQQFICQKKPSIRPTLSPPTTTTTSLPVVYSAKCGPNWEERPTSDWCYQFHEGSRGHREALAICQSQQGTLVSITDHSEQSYLAGRTQAMQSEVLWTGATDSAVEGGWRWGDGAPFAYFNWDAGQPDNSNNSHCAAMLTKTSRWNDLPCTLELGFICKKLASTHTTTPRPTTTPLPAGKFWSCPTGYIGYHGNCYVTHSTLKTWVDAQRSCRAEGGDLASLADQQENDFLFSMLPSGLQNKTGSWLGLSETGHRGQFSWSDGQPVTFTFWLTAMPLFFPSPSCALITKDSRGGWVNAPCNGVAKYVCKRPMTVNTVTSLSPFRVGCPPRALGYGSLCYSLVATPMAWSQAQQFCSRSHGHLATANSIAVQSFVSAQLDRDGGPQYWIGLSDLATPGTYVWASGDRLRFTAWNSNHTGNERSTCVGMQTRLPVGLWSNLACETARPFVCQYPRKGFTTPSLPTTSTTPLPTTPPPCAGGWTGFQGYCYKAISGSGSRKSWSDARVQCRNFGAELASIHNDQVHGFFKDTLLRGLRYTGGNFWIGLTDADVESTYLWSDGSPVDYTKWSPGEPNNAGGNEDCGEYNTYTNAWNDNSCYIPNPYICALPAGAPVRTTLYPVTTTPVPRCDGTEWLAKDGHCYYVSPLFGQDSKKTWFEARRFCQRNGADLASIESADVNTFLVQYTTRQQATLRQYWIGFNRLGGQNYEWTDKSPVVYTSWSSSEPNDAYGGQMCANLYSMSGLWNDDNCNDELHFICKRGNGTVTPQPPIPTPLIKGGCPPLFSGVGNKCYYVGGVNASTALAFTAARDTCRNMTSIHPVDIASISNHQEQAFVMSLLEGIGAAAYIGLNDLHINGKFVWQNNEEVTVTYWAPNQPSETWAHYGTAKEDCVVMREEEKIFGQWDDTYCGNPHAYVCQTMKDPHYPLTGPMQGSCRQSDVFYRDSCYGVYRTALSWPQAESTCRRDLGHLVSLRDVHELATVSVFVYERVVVRPVWIGLTFDQKQQEYGWVDGWPVRMTRWGEGEPNSRTNKSCVAMSEGLWNDTSCDEAFPFVCKMSSVTPPPTTAPPPGYCKNPDWASYGAFCYLADPMNKKSWPEANYLCRQQGMELLSLHDEGELSFVQNLVDSAITTPRYSFGRSAPKRVWLGLQRTLEGGFRWSDQSPFDYLVWNPGEPNNMHGEEQCAELMVDSGKWNDIACISGNSAGERGFVCKTPKIIPTTETTTTTPPQPTTTTTKTRTRTTTTASPGTGLQSTQSRGRTAKSTGNSGGATLSGGKIAGIVIGLLALIIIVCAIVYIVRRRLDPLTSADHVEGASGFENALYTRGNNKEQVSLTPKLPTSAHVTNGSNMASVEMNSSEHEDC